MTTKTMPTREEILAEPSGPRLDAWVAEYVMGWTRESEGRMRPYWLRDGKPFAPVDEFTPSEDIAAAWQVVEAIKLKFHEGHVSVSVTRTAAGNPDYRYECSVCERIYEPSGWADTLGKYHSSADGPTMPLTVCRAALLGKLKENQ